MDGAGEEGGGIVPGHFLHVLRQGDEGGAAIGGIEHGRDRLRQRRDDLLGMNDAVPIAGHRPEGVVDGGRGGGKMLDLLEDGVGAAVDEGVAGQEQHRQAVGVGDAGRRDHVERAGADRARRHHDLAPEPRLGEADRGQRHGLLVLAAPGRQRLLHRFQCLGETGHVAVAENGEDARKERDFLVVVPNELVA